jgi:hypothetical protein
MSCNCSTTPDNAKCINTCPCICDIESVKTFDADSFYNKLQSNSRKSVRTYTDEIKKKLVEAAREGKNKIKIDDRFHSHELAIALGAGLFGIKDKVVTTCIDIVIFGGDKRQEFDISNEKQFVEEMKCALDLHLTKLLNIMREHSEQGWFSCEIFTDFPNFIRHTLGKQFAYGAYNSTFNTLLISW